MIRLMSPVQPPPVELTAASQTMVLWTSSPQLLTPLRSGPVHGTCSPRNSTPPRWVSPEGACHWSWTQESCMEQNEECSWHSMALWPPWMSERSTVMFPL